MYLLQLQIHHHDVFVPVCVNNEPQESSVLSDKRVTSVRNAASRLSSCQLHRCDPLTDGKPYTPHEGTSHYNIVSTRRRYITLIHDRWYVEVSTFHTPALSKCKKCGSQLLHTAPRWCAKTPYVLYTRFAFGCTIESSEPGCSYSLRLCELEI